VRVEVRLTGKAATQAQTLVAELLSEGVEVRPAEGPVADADRDLESIATDFAVGLAVEATVTVVRAAVDRWRSKFAIDSGDVSLSDDADSDGADSDGAAEDDEDGAAPS